jgi:hypothetical protein
MVASRGGASGGEKRGLGINSSLNSGGTNMKEALQAAAATAAANTLGAGVGSVAKAVVTGAAGVVGVGPGGAATAATATALMGVQKQPPLLQPHSQGGGGGSGQPPALLQDLMLRSHGLVPPTTASALTARPPSTNAPLRVPTPPLRLKAAAGVEGFANASPQHPLDPLSIQELETAGLLAGRALAASKLYAEPLEAVRLADVCLHEPLKARLVTYQGKTLREALAWGMPRMAQATAFSVASGKTYRVLVDLSAGVRDDCRVCGLWLGWGKRGESFDLPQPQPDTTTTKSK